MDTSAQPLRRGVIIMSIIHGLALIDRTMVAGAMPLIRDTIAMSDVEAGWLLGTPFALSFAASALVLGRMADRVPARRLMIVGLAAWSVASAAIGLVDTVAGLALCRVALGIGQAAFIPSAIAWIVDAAPQNRRPAAVAAFTFGSTVGRCTALLIVGIVLGLLQNAGAGADAWRWLFIVTTLPNAVALIVLITLPIAATLRTAAMPAIDRDAVRALLPYFAIALMPLTLVQAIGGWLPMLWVEARGLAPRDAAVQLGVLALIGAPAGQVLGGWMMTRSHRARALAPAIMAGLTAAAVFPLVLLGRSEALVLAAGGVLLVNLILGVATFSALYGLQALVPAGRRGAVNGAFFAFVTMAGIAIGPLLAGLLTALNGTDSHAIANALVMTGVIVATLAVPAAFWAQRTYRALLRPS